MKAFLPFMAIATSSLLSLASFSAQAADGTIAIAGTVSESTCSINGAASGSSADKSITLPSVSAGSLSTAGTVGGTSGPSDLALTLSGCTGTATKAIARFENGPTVDQGNGYLNNSGTATKVQVRLLNAQMQPINITTNSNNDISANATMINGGNASLTYFAQYYSMGKATAGTVSTSVQYTMQYQ